ncbi:porin family protein [Blastochloris sulfoviridis]|uniref:Porin family protein n=2 Tax=Blastochloris sulfoviridis TaxID=50712 RepID=A0A5M6HUP7_9HYPH|nr:porin family protein [Blastochloris sulfoviridis]
MKMRRITLALLATTMIAGTASAADLSARRYEPAAAAYAFSWTGFYVGGHLGYGWGSNDWTAPSWAPGSVSTDFDGFVGGGQLGFNYQMGNIVLGLQGDLSGANLEGKVFDIDGDWLENKATWIAALTARLGFTADRALFYIKGGAAWTDVDSTAVVGNTVYSKSETRDGWTLGAGVEYAFAPNWTTFVEYDYYDFGNKNTIFDGDLYKVDTDVSVVKVGVNYRFGY